MSLPEAQRRWWGWGAGSISAEPPEGLYRFLSERIEPWPDFSLPPPDLEGMDLRPAKRPVELDKILEQVLGPDNVSSERYTRLLHAAGRSYRDLIRLRLNRLPAPPDVVVYPESHEQVNAVLAAAVDHGAAVVPFGGGTNVVGCFDLAPEIRPVVCLDLSRLNRVLSIDPQSLTARVQAGITGPDLEEVLNQAGCTLGHFPQSFEFSTLGGWIATRGAGHKSTRYGKIEDLVLGLRLATPVGEVRTPVSPSHAVGADLTSLLIGSEGSLGVITEAVLKLHPKPGNHWFRAFLFPVWAAGVEAVRKIMARGLKPAVLRLSDRTETAALMNASGSGPKGFWSGLIQQHLAPLYLSWRGLSLERACLLLIMDEGEAGEIRRGKKIIHRICRIHGGVPAGAGPARMWHETRFTAPYLRDEMIGQGLMVDTLETAATWDRLPELYSSVRQVLAEALTWSGVTGLVMAHLSHAYLQGANLYFTFIAPQVRGREEEQWLRVKAAATEAVLSGGGALSHHHGVGRDHKPWFTRFWGRELSSSFRAAKKNLDPQAVLNPGVIFEPEAPSLQRPLSGPSFSPAARLANLRRMNREIFDLLVIGGGIVGAGVAWDASLRGLSAALVEKNDFGSGTSGKSSRMIHGGLRYLKMLDLKLVREALSERQHLMKMAPHLIRPQEHIIPVYKGQGEGLTVLHVGLWGYDTLAGGKGLPPHKTLTTQEVLDRVPMIKAEGLEGGLLYYDALTDDARLTLETVKAAALNGAVTANHLELVGLDLKGDLVVAAVKDHLTGRDGTVLARVAVNATGIWSDRIRLSALPGNEPLIRPAKGIHIAFPRSLKPIDQVIVMRSPEGRPTFAVPCGPMVYVGTTDDDYAGDLDAPRALAGEVDYLLAAVNRTFAGPPMTRDRITISWAGIRPLVSRDNKGEASRYVSREHEIRVDQHRLVTVSGGKLTTFRIMAAQTVDRVLSILDVENAPASRTADAPLCGVETGLRNQRTNWPDRVINRIKEKYGPRAGDILELARAPHLAALLDENLGLSAAEVYWAVQGEMALSLTDALVRRLGLTYGTPDAGMNSAPAVADLMAEALGWTPDETERQIKAYQELVRRETGFRNE